MSDIGAEMLHYNLNLLCDVRGVQIDEPRHFSLGGNCLQFRVIIDSLVDVAVSFPCHIVVEDIPQ